jgi:hypothetical protein
LALVPIGDTVGETMTIIGDAKFMVGATPFQDGRRDPFERIANLDFLIDGEEIAMRHLMVMLVIALIVLPAVSNGADYLYLDKKGNFKGRATDDGDTVRFYDKSNNPGGWYDRDTNTKFDKNNRPTGTIYDFDDD